MDYNSKVVMLKGADGAGITDIKKTSTNVLTDTYTVTLSDGRKQTFNVTNGKGISSIKKTGASGLTDTYTITYNDGTTSTFTVTNGENGTSGPNTILRNQKPDNPYDKYLLLFDVTGYNAGFIGNVIEYRPYGNIGKQANGIYTVMICIVTGKQIGRAHV